MSLVKHEKSGTWKKLQQRQSTALKECVKLV